MFAVLHLGEFALQAVLRLEAERPDGPVALLDGDQRGAIIAECTAAARQTGVEAGMTVPQALARCPRLIVRARQPAAEAEARAALLAAAFSLSPMVEATAPGVCTVQLIGFSTPETPTIQSNRIDGLRSGSLQGFRTDPQLIPETWDRSEQALHAALARLAAAGLHATGGIAATPLLALYAARLAPVEAATPPLSGCRPQGRSEAAGSPLLLVREGRAFLAPLPLAAADPSPAIAAIVAGWGIRTLGQFAALPKGDIARRLGAEGLALWDRCVGETDRPLRIVTPSPAFAARLDCEHELETVEPLLFILRRFVDRLVLELDNAGLAAGTLALELALSDETFHCHEIRLPQPSTQAEVLFRALGTYLDSLRTAASIAGVSLTIEPTRVALRQEGLFDCALRDPHGFTETLARAAALVGPGRVGAPQVQDTHRPDTVELKAPAEILPPLTPRFTLAPQGLALRRYRPPLPATVELAGRFPAYVWTASAQGGVQEHAGPWYGSGDWWQPDRRWEREEWDVELEAGGVHRLVRTPSGWFLEGEYD